MSLKEKLLKALQTKKIEIRQIDWKRKTILSRQSLQKNKSFLTHSFILKIHKIIITRENFDS